MKSSSNKIFGFIYIYPAWAHEAARAVRHYGLAEIFMDRMQRRGVASRHYNKWHGVGSLSPFRVPSR